jgi:hypothetical protein
MLLLLIIIIIIIIISARDQTQALVHARQALYH